MCVSFIYRVLPKKKKKKKNSKHYFHFLAPKNGLERIGSHYSLHALQIQHLFDFWWLDIVKRFISAIKKPHNVQRSLRDITVKMLKDMLEESGEHMKISRMF